MSKKLDYPYIRVWGFDIMGSYRYYVEAQLQKARDDGAPGDAVYYHQDHPGNVGSLATGQWITVRDCSRDMHERLNALIKNNHPTWINSGLILTPLPPLDEDLRFLLRRIPMDDGRRIYLEVGCERAQTPTFPAECPICGGQVAARGEDSILYRCGGHYLPKPQIQSHTDYYWGHCLAPDLNEGHLRRGKKEEPS